MPRRLAKYQVITGFFSGWEMKMKINHLRWRRGTTRPRICIRSRVHIARLFIPERYVASPWMNERMNEFSQESRIPEAHSSLFLSLSLSGCANSSIVAARKSSRYNIINRRCLRRMERNKSNRRRVINIVGRNRKEATLVSRVVSPDDQFDKWYI